ncbi:unnamed protein product [Phyllotreta striolata]|uniref:Uncharacterized protein n=1 Tax=Phyllotreta striolata TaxID=444603 RepID=A0A9N9XUQ2_PHYSR|nr:unnamed protein product [Phyllotreta striolata]
MEEPNIEFIESFLSKYKGGEIKLQKQYWDEGIALICINHVEKKNAISGKMMVDLRTCIKELEQWRTGKAVIMYGAGTNFCSGGDLAFARAESNPTAGSYMSLYMHETLKKFRNLPFVTFSLVHGPALGGGSELAVFCDYTIVSDTVQLGFVHEKMGIITAWGGTSRLVRIVGERRALEMLLSGGIHDARDCFNIGLAYKIVRNDRRLEETLDFVRTFTNSHYSVLQSYKRIANSDGESSFGEALRVERNEFWPKWGSEVNKEALHRNIKHL